MSCTPAIPTPNRQLFLLRATGGCVVVGSLRFESLDFAVLCLQFPNAVVLNAVVRRNTQMPAKERK